MEDKDLKRKNRRKRKKYRLLILLLLLFGTGIMLATSTYAWFTANKTVSIGTLQVKIEAKNGIQISADGTNWKSIVQKADLTGASGTYDAALNQLPSVLEAVSTTGEVDEDGHLPMYYGTIGTNADGNYILTSTKETDVDDDTGNVGKYIAFDLFFKVDSDTDIYITNNSGVKTTDTTDTGIKNASRIAFVTLGNTSAGSAVATIQALNEGTNSTVHIWEPNYDSHTAAGVANARDVYSTTTNEGTGNAILSYSGVKSEITTDDNVLLGNAKEANDSTKFKDVSITYKTKAGFTHYIPASQLKSGITKVRIYMWVEGQDVDCENNASNGNISFDLQITTELPEGTATTES